MVGVDEDGQVGTQLYSAIHTIGFRLCPPLILRVAYLEKAVLSIKAASSRKAVKRRALLLLPKTMKSSAMKRGGLLPAMGGALLYS